MVDVGAIAAGLEGLGGSMGATTRVDVGVALGLASVPGANRSTTPTPRARIKAMPSAKRPIFSFMPDLLQGLEVARWLADFGIIAP
jgi:hypothetical protein